MSEHKDKAHFINAMNKDLEAHTKRNHWRVIHKSDMPHNTKAIMSIWAFKLKRNPCGDVVKHKTRLCDHGGNQTCRENYWETFAPVVNWLSVRTMLTI